MRTFLPVRESVLAALFSAIVGKTNEYQIDAFASRNERFFWEAFGKIPFFKQWPGLRTGAVVRVAFSTNEPGMMGKSELSTQYFLTSAAPAESTAKKVAGMMRMQRVLEKKNICRLSVCWEERLGAEPDCGGSARSEANQRELRKLALALLENYRYCLWANGTNGENIEDITLEELQKRCEDPYAALECLVAGVGAL